MKGLVESDRHLYIWHIRWDQDPHARTDTTNNIFVKRLPPAFGEEDVYHIYLRGVEKWHDMYTSLQLQGVCATSQLLPALDLRLAPQVPSNHVALVEPPAQLAMPESEGPQPPHHLLLHLPHHETLTPVSSTVDPCKYHCLPPPPPPPPPPDHANCHYNQLHSLFYHLLLCHLFHARAFWGTGASQHTIL